MNTRGVVSGAARASGLIEVAHVGGITREVRYEALRPDAARRALTPVRECVCTALGIKLIVTVAANQGCSSVVLRN